MTTESKPGRKALPAPAAAAGTNDVAIAQAQQAATDLAQIAEAVSSEQLAFVSRLGERIGRNKALAAMEKLLRVTDLVDIQTLKESKAYKGMRVPCSDGSSVTVTTWEHFCRVALCRSREHVDEELANLKQFGVEMLDSFQALGMGYRQMRELRAIPADERTKLLEAAQTGDAKALVEAAEDMIERHQSERNKLEKKATEATKAAAAKDAVIKAKDDKLNELLLAEERRRSAEPSEREAAQLDAIADAGLAAEMAVRQLVKAAADVIGEPVNEITDTAARQAVYFVAQTFAHLINEAGIDVDFAEMTTPHWLRDVSSPATPQG
jgi:hypothetical protein